MVVPPRHEGKHILFLETLVVLKVLKSWGAGLEGCRLLYRVDNMTLSACLRSGRCEQKAIMSLIRYIIATTLEQHINLVPD